MFDILKTDKEKYKKFVDDFRRDNIPKRFNQIELVDELLNEDLDHYLSISNRSDGKSFNYIHFFMNFAIEYDVYFTLISRQFTIRSSYQQLILKILKLSKTIKEKDVEFLNTQYYMAVLWKDKMIGVITDLNSATQLKYLSNFMVDYPIILFDEFLALEGDYLSDEWERLKTIYSTIDRDVEIDLIKYPKVFYLGNAVNFSSPILNNLNLFNVLEKHPINTVNQYDNVYLEMARNDNANEERNLRAFNESLDSMTHGEFKTNAFNLAGDRDRKEVMVKNGTITIKLDFNYLIINYNRESFKIVLAIVGYSEEYDYNLQLKDNTENSIYLKESYLSRTHPKKYNKGAYLFDNNYSKDFITNNDQLNQIKIMKLISENELSHNHLSDFDKNEKSYQKTYERITKENLFKKFFDDYE